jgi:drug/metabolite transporter (DMT)-like permease
MSDTLRGAIYGILAASIWGGMYVVSDVVLEIIPPFTLLSIRLMMGALVLGLLVWQKKDTSVPERQQLIQVLGVGLVGFGVSVGAQFVGTDKSTAVNGALITTSSPAFILVFAAFILREKLSFQRVMAVILASIGVIVIIDPAQANFSSDTFVGNVALAVAGVTWGLYSVLVRVVSTRLDTLWVTLIAFFGGMMLTIPSAGVELTSRAVGEITFLVFLGILYLGVISTAGAMWLWNRAFALVDASAASLFFFAQPLVGAVLGVLALGQDFTLNLAFGGLLISLGVLLAMYVPKRKSVPA